ncbi:sulfite exporter TauE/SafE family protein [Meiothermus granaticius]|uniref:Probable membrane transporter protein n=1 Tax=Meiothermus granaticius NBRC 107808 TaxID=1227551 RepID=A0A399F791_9DEIN|nr:sulfite exporter TauE/SafE family protein [Meiothermus granaticius]RIH91516.1 Sulfite exporter TauE/SafE [Meiothermus granaticius NBRC 107808]GEM88249.1 UPF0721 transmembrane protein [Meiothermus granaticius NBRC 107808]
MILAWVGAVLIGLSLGMLGSGGAILTVPVLVFLVGEPSKLAIAESLAIVGLIALFGAIPYALKAQVSWFHVLVFGLPGMVGTYFGAYASKWIPGPWQMGLFAVVILFAAYRMYRPSRAAHPPAPRPAWKLSLEGLSVGVLSGVVGVGGGFLIVPALVLMGRLDMTLAVGTSLVVITLNSASGFYKYLHLLPQWGYSVHWHLVGLFAVLGVVGSFIGRHLGSRIPQPMLRQGFAGFLLVMGGFILWQDLGKLLR